MAADRYVRDPADSGDFVLADVTVVDPGDGRTTAHQDVHVRAGRIADVSATGGAAEHVAQVRRIDAGGLFVVPGFVDCHVHMLNHPDDVDGASALMLAAGVVGYRQMSGNDELLDRRAAGTLPRPAGAPQLLALPGDLLTPITAPDERGAEQAVRHQAERGADFIKAGFTSRATFLAALRTAQEVGVKLGGHLPGDIDPREASREGTWSVEHLGTSTTMFAACSRREEQVRAMSRPLPRLPRLPGLAPLLNQAFLPLLMKVVVNPAARTGKRTAEAYRLADRTFEERKARELCAILRENETWQCATLIRLHTQQFPSRHREDPRLRWMAPEQVARWQAATETFEKLPDDIRDALAEHWDAQQRLAGILAEEDVPMVVGTDADDAGWIIPGFGLHDEFDLLADSGVTPLQILRGTTSDAARFLGREDVAGAVRPGYEADLVLLGADPTRHVSALHDIRAVVRAGRYRDRAALDSVLSRLEEDPSAL